MMHRPHQRSSLLRASDFCQPRRPIKREVKVSFLSFAPKSKRTGGVEWDFHGRIYLSETFMVALSLKQGDIAWLQSIDQEGVPVVVYISPEHLKSDNDSIIHAPPILAASIGLIGSGRTECRAWLESHRGSIPKANIVKVRQIGRPVRKRSLLQPQTEQDVNLIYLLQQSNNNNKLLSYSSLISTFDAMEGELHFFEVIEFESDDVREGEICNSGIFRTSLGTLWQMVESHDVLQPRLPCLSLSRCFHQSILKDPGHELTVINPELQLSKRHVSFDEMVCAMSISTYAQTPQKVLHVVGTDENHVEVCVKTAAGHIGMRYLLVHGMAAYAHACGEVVSSGSLGDQIAGLRVAMKDANDCAPCVLHLHDFQSELDHSDEPLRHQQEQRFWTTIMDGLTPRSTTTNTASKYRTHPVLVIISTEQQLSAGPLRQNIIHASVKIQPPDDAYTEDLWGKDNFESFSEHLVGRSAEEILHLKRQWEFKCEELASDPSFDAISLLPSLCEDFDSKKTKTSVNIPNVHWEDVGGLAHVRQEIMDTIELPLRHPHLFPHSGRSGILLYGPPGTGKTLVAKAVATECKLPFLSVKGPELLGSYVGESEANVRAAFASAREAAAAAHVGTCATSGHGGAAILFFDELDSLAPRRGGVGDGGGVMERVVSTLSTELDGGRRLEGINGAQPIVFVIGATNRPDLLDPSLLRPGRLDRLVFLGLASKSEDRAQILAALMRNFKLEDGKDAVSLALEVVDRLPQSLTGADFSAIASGALMRSLHRLCAEVEAEISGLEEGEGGSGYEKSINVENVLKDRLEPVVTMMDLLEEGREVVPSVSAAELEKYEGLRVQFSCS